MIDFNKNQKNIDHFLKSAVILIYFSLMIFFYFTSKYMGTDGVSFLITGKSDDGLYYWSMVQTYLNTGVFRGSTIYPKIISLIVKFINLNDVIIIRIFNFIGFIILFESILYLLKLLIKNTYANRYYFARHIIYVFLVFYPSLISNTTLSIYRDIWIYAFYVLTIFWSLKLVVLKEIGLKSIFITLTIILILYNLRDYVILSWLSSIIVYLIFTNVERKTMILFGLVLIIFGAFYFYYLRDFKIPYIGQSLTDIFKYRNYFITIYPGSTQMNIAFDSNNYLKFLFSIILSFFNNLYGPFLWQINSKFMFIFFIFESLPLFFISLYIFRNRKNIDKKQLFLLINSIVWLLLISVSNDNIGTATRLRPLSVILIVLVCISIWVNNYSTNGMETRL